MLRSCLAVADGGDSRFRHMAVKTFVHTCGLALSHTRRIPGAVRAIEMTITHKTGVAYGKEVIETMMWLRMITYLSPTRLVVVYKSPLPGIKDAGRYRADGFEWA
jgi:hypothetical protein